MIRNDPDKHDARVTTLTAEVQVLMIGSRQVTLSVLRQLDVISFMRISPFGRVRDRGQEWIIGRDPDSGSLVKSFLHEGRIEITLNLSELQPFDGHIRVCRYEIPKRQYGPERRNCHSIYNNENGIVVAPCEAFYPYEDCKCSTVNRRIRDNCTSRTWISSDLEAFCVRELQRFQDRLESLRDFDLIVLAGLK